MKRVTGFLAITFLLAVVIPGPGSAVAAAQELKREAIIEGAKKEGKVQIYGLLAVPEHMQIIERFKGKYPFIEPSLYRATSERLYTRIENEARANAHLVDVIGVSGFQYYQLLKRGLIGKYESPERRSFDPAFKDKDGHWTAYYVNPMVTAYNTRQLTPQEAPKDYGDLIDPKWKGKLVMEEEEIEWFSTMMTFWGEEKGIVLYAAPGGAELHHPPWSHADDATRRRRRISRSGDRLWPTDPNDPERRRAHRLVRAQPHGVRHQPDGHRSAGAPSQRGNALHRPYAFRGDPKRLSFRQVL